MSTRYRVVDRQDGWVVEILDGLPVVIGGQRVSTPEWEVAGGPFPTKEEAERESARIQGDGDDL